MSHSFYVNNLSGLSYKKIAESLGIAKLSFVDEVQVPEDGAWPQGTSYLYIDETSVRPLEISYDNDVLQVRIFQGSSLDDYILA